MTLEMAIDTGQIETHVQPCLIHKAVFAWLNYDPKKYFTRRNGMTSEQIARRGGTKGDPELHKRIYNLRNPPYGKAMRIRDVAELLDVSESTVKTYSKRYRERKCES
jgi:hypothetical protein